MAITKSTRVVSRAGKAKNRKFYAKERFSTGHDGACRALLPENIRLPKREGIRVYRSETFGMSKAARVAHDAQHLLNIGLTDDPDRAIDAAIEAIEAPTARTQAEFNELASYEKPTRGRP